MPLRYPLFKALALSLLCSQLLTACPETPAQIETSAPLPEAFASAAPEEPGITDLITGSVISNEEAQLRDTQTRQSIVKYPIRVATVFSRYTSELKEVDQVKILDTMQKHFQDSALIRDSFHIPSSIVDSGSSIDEIRKQAARFQVDVVIIINGYHHFKKSDQQPFNFFSAFEDKANYESEVQLTALAMDVFIGTYLSPASVATFEGPELLDPLAEDFYQRSYAVKLKAETSAWEKLQDNLLERFATYKKELENRPQPTPVPTPTPEPTIVPSEEPSEEPSETPASTEAEIEGV